MTNAAKGLREVAALLREGFVIRLGKLTVGMRDEFDLYAALTLREHVERRNSRICVDYHQLFLRATDELDEK